MSTTPSHPNRMFFVNIPVADLQASIAFFTKLGFTFNEKFTDESATCMLVGEQAFVMLLAKPKFEEFSHLPVADPRTHALALYCFSAESREQVDALAEQAIAAGAKDTGDVDDYGFMYSRSFFDLDGHGWQVMWMDPAAAEAGPEEYAAAQDGAAA